MAQDTIRSFLAIELSDNTKSEAENFIQKIQNNFQMFRFIPSQDWHLTLHFFGDISLEKIEALRARLPEVTSKIKPFSVLLGEMGGFPNSRNPRLLWLGLHSVSNQLTPLKVHLDRALQEMRFETEAREFHPHITIARLKKDATAHSVPDFGAQFNGSVPTLINHVTLFRSILSSSGAEYRPLEIFKLGKTESNG